MRTRREFLRVSFFTGFAVAFRATADVDRASESARAASRYLISRQSADGAWRSDHYAAFRDGDPLTPLIMRTLARMQSRETDDALSRGRRWLERLTDSLRPEPEPWVKLKYPLFTASDAARYFASTGDTDRAAFWSKLVARLRIDASLGWTAHAEACGAWSDSPIPPLLPAGTTAIPDMLAPNISATVLGLEAAADNAKTALPFLFRCQNFADRPDNRFDDGGFMFAIDDPVRNKAGVAGTDSTGQRRFHSYGSATCDGLLALSRCGLPMDHPRVDAALAWLRRHINGIEHPGAWPSHRAEARDSLVYYYAQGLAQVLAWISSEARHRDWAREQKARLVRDLLRRQTSDGSWTGLAPESCEDDPLLATAFGLRSVS